MGNRPWGAFVLAWAAVQAVGIADVSPDVLLLARFKQKIRQDLGQVPNYTCLETMERSQREPRARSFQPVDIVRVEVSVVNGKELYAWPGARQFEDKELASFIKTGAIANGMFAVSAHELFVVDHATLQYRGEEKVEGVRAVRYDFRIPQFLSGQTIRRSGISATVASKGSFWFDPVSLDLIRLDRYGDAMPASRGLAEAFMSIVYTRQRIGSSDTLLARRAEVSLAEFSGQVSRNAVEFSQCRVYRTESTISFGPPPEAPAVEASAAEREVRLPAGLLVPVVLETALDSKTAALGDRLQARVREDVRQKGELVLPAGAVVSGRIRRLDRQVATTPYFVIAIELSEVAWKGSRADFYGELVEKTGGKGVSAGGAVQGMATLIVNGKKFLIAPGLEMLWRILDRPRDPDQQPR